MREDVVAEQVSRLAHNGQCDRQGESYIRHPERIARSFPEDTPQGALRRAVGWLHDVVEDTDVSIEWLKNFGFSPEVIASVALLTHLPSESYQAYIAHLKESGNETAVAVKVADLKDNLRPGCPAHLRVKYAQALRELSPDDAASFRYQD